MSDDLQRGCLEETGAGVSEQRRHWFADASQRLRTAGIIGFLVIALSLMARPVDAQQAAPGNSGPSLRSNQPLSAGAGNAMANGNGSRTANGAQQPGGAQPQGAGDLNQVPVQAPELVVPPVIDSSGPLAPGSLGNSVKILVLLTLLSLAPSILMMTTCFVRFIIVFGLLRQALGTQNLPPAQVITALSVFLTIFVMTPVWRECYDAGIAPYINNRPYANEQPGNDRQMLAVENTFRPMRQFMSQQIHKAGGEDVVWMLVDFRRPDPASSAGREWKEPETFDDVDWSVIVTSYLLTELKAAFLIGFQIYLPFVVIDMVVSTVLTGMGMVMLPPTLVSLPFKLLLFVLIDGWMLTVQMLLQSVDPSFR